MEKKRKSRHEKKEGKPKRKVNMKKAKIGGRRKRNGPRLPNALRKQVEAMDALKPSTVDEEEIESDDANDLYEYEEAVAEEESRKNRRYDPVDNFEYELPEQFEDENVASEEDEDNGDPNGSMEEEGDEVEEEDEGRHARMLKEITGLPVEAFLGKKRKSIVISEAYPESEYNPSRDVLDGDGRISIQDLLVPLHGKSGFSKLRKSMHRMEKKSMPVQAPLPKADRDKLERKVAYENQRRILLSGSH